MLSPSIFTSILLLSSSVLAAPAATKKAKKPVYDAAAITATAVTIPDGLYTFTNVKT